MNYYNTLGLNKNASKDDIKTAYRKMAMKHHPDRGGDEKKFKEIEEAYRTLSDPDKRRMIDMGMDPNSAGGNQGTYNQGPFEFHFGAGNFHDVFNTFGFGGRQQQVRRNKSLSIIVVITLLEALNGKDVSAEISAPNGSKKLVNIRIPAGVEDGQQIKYKGIGDQSIVELPPGDLIVNIKVNPHPIFKRDGDMLMYDKTIPVWDAILGSSFTLETLDKKKLNINIPPGTQPDTILSCKGEGMISIRTGQRGNLLIKIHIDIPRKLNETEINMVRQLKSTYR
jgi:curved DNA-binding protein